MATAQGDLPEADRLFGESLKIAERLAASDPDNAAWQRDLSISLEKLAKVSVEQDDLPAAQGFLQQALAISENLADADTTSATMKRTVWVHHAQLAGVLEKRGDATARQHWRAAHDVLAGMVEAGLHVSPKDQGFLGKLREKIGE